MSSLSVRFESIPSASSFTAFTSTEVKIQQNWKQYRTSARIFIPIRIRLEADVDEVLNMATQSFPKSIEDKSGVVENLRPAIGDSAHLN
jgi:hypothetical protein